MSVSVLCGVKDRSEHLLQSYKSWLDCECVDEVVIVDWGSKEPISQKLDDNEKLKIIQMNPNHTKYWAFSQAYNTAARFASGDTYLILNADEIIFSSESLCNLEKPNSEFCYEGTSWESEKAHGVYFLYISKESFWKINGYHEDIIGYGYDDVDLRRRIKESAVEIKTSNAEIEHIKHDPGNKSSENMLNYAISWSYTWSVMERLIELDYKAKGNIIYCDIAMRDRLTYEYMLDRRGRARALSEQEKEFGV